ncbi:lipocalin-like domain-containing protein [Secundilactobacillus collinoides]|nr:lipocalin-like domain-containing protein [Secundilactobacillus collinoides]
MPAPTAGGEHHFCVGVGNIVVGIDHRLRRDGGVDIEWTVQFFCLFNLDSKNYRLPNLPELPKGTSPMVVLSQVCDYTTGTFQSIAKPVFVNLENIFDKKTNSIEIHQPQNNLDVSFGFKGGHVHLKAETEAYSCNLEMSGADRVMWMTDNALKTDGLIREGVEGDRSFYYSLHELPVTGALNIEAIESSDVQVSGAGWIDRQWGDFLTRNWEWTSFRFADGDRVNTYNFDSGYQVGLLQTSDGKNTPFNSFKVVQNSYAKSKNNVWFSYGWDYHMPVKDGAYHLVPLSPKNVIAQGENEVLFEGLSRLLDSYGNQVGWAVTETMDIRKVHNGPYDKFNNF